jgi:hypothetical protein
MALHHPTTQLYTSRRSQFTGYPSIDHQHIQEQEISTYTCTTTADIHVKILAVLFFPTHTRTDLNVLDVPPLTNNTYNNRRTPPTTTSSAVYHKNHMAEWVRTTVGVYLGFLFSPTFPSTTSLKRKP